MGQSVLGAGRTHANGFLITRSKAGQTKGSCISKHAECESQSRASVKLANRALPSVWLVCTSKTDHVLEFYLLAVMKLTSFLS